MRSILAIARQRIQLPQGAWRTAVASLIRGDLWVGPQVAEFEQGRLLYSNDPLPDWLKPLLN